MHLSVRFFRLVLIGDYSVYDLGSFSTQNVPRLCIFHELRLKIENTLGPGGGDISPIKSVSNQKCAQFIRIFCDHFV